MDKKIEDYLHLYLGCQVQVQRFGTKDWHTGIMVEVTKGSNHGDWIDVRFEDCIEVYGHNSMEKVFSNFHTYFIRQDFIKPILRKLSDMTDEEKIWFENKTMLHNSEVDEYVDEIMEHGTPEIFLYCLSKHFDLFGLIEAGLAIDKKN